jgi:DNA-binding MarR family transcriptional regulator
MRDKPKTAKDRHQYLMSGLLEGWDWFDNGLQNVLRESGWKHLNKSQSMMVLYISAGVQRPIEIARKMRLSRQAIRHIEQQLVQLGIITARDDPHDRRSKILVFSARSKRLRNAARQTILNLEALLASRLGVAKVAALRTVLNLDWGDVVRSLEDLERPQPIVRPRGTPVRERVR